MRVVVDIVAVTLDDYVCLIKRGKPPFQNQWALPGGHVEDGERLEDAARRELAEETGLVGGIFKQLGVYDDPTRDPRGHALGIAFVWRGPRVELNAGTDARDATWTPFHSVPKLAFDHDRILNDGIKSLRRW